MRQRRVELRQSAVEDLSELFEYVMNKSGSETVAQGYVERLIATCLKIGEVAEGGRARDDLAPGLRTWTFERRATITYRIVGDVVDVTGIYHGGRTFERAGRLLRSL